MFYHESGRKFLDKILKIGLVPKSRFDYPERIYLTTDIEDLDNMELKNDDITILKIQLKNKQKLYLRFRKWKTQSIFKNLRTFMRSFSD